MSKLEPSWLTLARRYVGVAEIKGPHHHSAIIDLLHAADGDAGDGKTLQGIADDETPWCASFACGVLELDGRQSPRSAWARSFLTWGKKVPTYVLGGIAVLERGPSSGHVGFIVGRDAANCVLLLGGNQSDSVKISAFHTHRVLDIRWPSEANWPTPIGWNTLPLLDVGGAPSLNEA